MLGQIGQKSDIASLILMCMLFPRVFLVTQRADQSQTSTGLSLCMADYIVIEVELFTSVDCLQIVSKKTILCSFQTTEQHVR